MWSTETTPEYAISTEHYYKLQKHLYPLRLIING